MSIHRAYSSATRCSPSSEAMNGRVVGRMKARLMVYTGTRIISEEDAGKYPFDLTRTSLSNHFISDF